jgi:hypothetical protein
MGKHYIKYFTLILVFCLGINSIIIANDYRTRDSGDWTSTIVWQQNTANGNQSPNWVNYNNSMSTSFGSSANKLTFIIRSGHTITLNSDLSIEGNNLTIIIEPGGQFIVSSTAQITLSGNGAEFEINGNMEVNGTINFTGNNGEIIGDGTITGEGTITGNYIEGAGIGNSLPIELLDFTAKIVNQGVKLTWITAAEINNDFFTIERSRNGVNWETLTFVQGAGNSNQVLTYTWEDDQPLNGISYYRLKQTDFDGQFEFFSPVAVNFNSSVSKSEIVQVAAFGQQMDILLSNPTEAAYLVISDIQGRIIHRQMIDGSDAVQQITVNLPGNYSGNVMVIRLTGQHKSDERKIRVS